MDQNRKYLEPQIIINSLLVFVTLILVVVTTIYVRHTKNMSQTMSDQFDLSYKQHLQNNRPYLLIDTFDFVGSDKDNFLFLFNVKNTSNIPARFQQRIQYITDDAEYLLGIQQNLYGEDSYIFPSPNGTEFRFSKPEDKNLLDKISNSNDVKIKIIFTYWGIGDTNKENTFTYEEQLNLIKDPKNLSKMNFSIDYIKAD